MHKTTLFPKQDKVQTHQNQSQEETSLGQISLYAGIALTAIAGIAVAFSPEAQAAIAGACVVLAANPWSLVLIALALIALAAFVYFYNASSCAPVQSSSGTGSGNGTSHMNHQSSQKKNSQNSNKPVFPSSSSSNNKKTATTTSKTTVAPSTYLSQEQQQQAAQSKVIEAAEKRWTDAKFKRGLLDVKPSGGKKLSEEEAALIQELVLALKSKNMWKGDENAMGENLDALKAAADVEVEAAYQAWQKLVKEAAQAQK